MSSKLSTKVKKAGLESIKLLYKNKYLLLCTLLFLFLVYGLLFFLSYLASSPERSYAEAGCISTCVSNNNVGYCYNGYKFCLEDNTSQGVIDCSNYVQAQFDACVTDLDDERYADCVYAIGVLWPESLEEDRAYVCNSADETECDSRADETFGDTEPTYCDPYAIILADECHASGQFTYDEAYGSFCAAEGVTYCSYECEDAGGSSGPCDGYDGGCSYVQDQVDYAATCATEIGVDCTLSATVYDNCYGDDDVYCYLYSVLGNRDDCYAACMLHDNDDIYCDYVCDLPYIDISPPTMNVIDSTGQVVFTPYINFVATATDESNVASVGVINETTESEQIACTAKDGAFDSGEEPFICENVDLVEGENTLLFHLEDNAEGGPYSGEYEYVVNYVVPTDNLVAYWDLESAESSEVTQYVPTPGVWEGSGSVSQVEGYQGNALDFNDKYMVNHDPHGKYSFSKEGDKFSVEAWVKLDSYPSSYPRVVSKESADGDAWALGVTVNHTVYCILVPGGDYTGLEGGPEIPLDEWTKIGCSWDGEKLVSYIGDIEADEATIPSITSLDFSSGNVNIGSGSFGNDRVDFMIDEVKIYYEEGASTPIMNVLDPTGQVVFTPYINFVATATEEASNVASVGVINETTESAQIPCTAKDGVFDSGEEPFICENIDLALGENLLLFHLEDSVTPTPNSGEYEYAVNYVVPTDNLVAYWDLESAESSEVTQYVPTPGVWEGSGSVSQVEGYQGNALDFNDKYMVNHDPHGKYSFSKEGDKFSIEAWVKLDSYPSGYPRVVSKESADGDAWGLGVTVNHTVYCFLVPGGNYTGFEGGPEIPLDEWTKIGCSWDGEKLVSYIGDIEADEATIPSITSLDFSSGNVNIGSGSFGNDRVDFMIDEVKIYNNVDNTAPIVDIYPFENASAYPDKRPLFEGQISDENKIASAEYLILGTASIPYDDDPETIPLIENDIDTYDWQPFYPEDETWDSSEENFSFTPANDLSDGTKYIYMRATDEFGNKSIYEKNGWLITSGLASDSVMAYYRFYVQAVDTSAPIFYAHEILPDPTTDTTPSIKGAVGDDASDLVSNIVGISYRLNEGEWTDVVAYDGQYDSSSEEFFIQFDELPYGDYYLEIDATDAASNVGHFTDDFTIEEIPVTDAEVVSLDEGFNQISTEDFYNTTGVWGRGIARLRQKVDFSYESVLYTNNSEMGYMYGSRSTGMEKGLYNGLWLRLNDGQFMHYDTQSGVYTYYTVSVEGYNHIQNIYEFEFESERYLFITLGLGESALVYDINNSPDLTSDDSYFSYSFLGIEGWLLPFTIVEEGGGIAVYGLSNNSEGIGLVKRLDLKDTIMVSADDEFITWGSEEGIADIVGGIYDKETGSLILSAYSHNVAHNCFLSDTPAYRDDDVCVTYDPSTNPQGFIFYIVEDNNGNFWGSGNGGIFMIDINDTVDPSDDKWIKLVGYNEINNERGMKIFSYPENYPVGDEIWFFTREGHLRGVDTNSTFSEDGEYRTDDTAYNFSLPSELYKSYTEVDGVMTDQNTGWIFMPNAGLYKVTLDRDFEDINTIDVKPVAPQGKLEVNHITLNSVIGTFVQGTFSGMHVSADNGNASFFVSNDDGVSWYPITVGGTVDFPTSDYQLKFRAALRNIDGTSPVLDNVNLYYASYPQPSTIDSSFALNYQDEASVGDLFPVDILFTDTLGFTPNWNGAVNMSLFKAEEPSVPSDCINYPASVQVVSGEESFDVDAECIGDFIFTGIAEDGKFAIGGIISITSITCGNGVVDSGEQCDGGIGSTTCDTLGYDGGDLACLSTCTFDTSNCESNFEGFTVAVCGNNIIETGEECDGTISSEFICGDLGFDGGELACSSDCILNTFGCYRNPICGDGIIEGDEECDGDVIQKTCSDFSDYDGGNLGCTDECKFDFSQCPFITEKLPGDILITGLPATGVSRNVLIIVLSGIGISTGAFSFILAFPMIIKRKEKKAWGVIYNQKNGNPVAFTSVRLYQDGNLIKEKVTDLDGRFGFIVDDGRYTIEVQNDAYEVYRSDIDVKNSSTSNITDNIPLVPLAQTHRSIVFIFKKALSNARALFPALSKYLFVLGLLWSIFATILYPLIVNYFVIIFYAIEVTIYAVSELRKTSGKVYDSATNKGIGNVFVRLFNLDNKLLDIQVTDQKGRYLFTAKEGDYSILCSKGGYSFPSSKQALKIKKVFYGSLVEIHSSGNVVSSDLAMDRVGNEPIEGSLFESPF